MRLQEPFYQEFQFLSPFNHFCLEETIESKGLFLRTCLSYRIRTMWKEILWFSALSEAALTGHTVSLTDSRLIAEQMWEISASIHLFLTEESKCTCVDVWSGQKSFEVTGLKVWPALASLGQRLVLSSFCVWFWFAARRFCFTQTESLKVKTQSWPRTAWYQEELFINSPTNELCTRAQTPNQTEW